MPLVAETREYFGRERRSTNRVAAETSHGWVVRSFPA